MKKATIFSVILFLLAGVVPVLDAQENAPAPDLKEEIIRVNYIDARSAYSILLPYISRNGKLQLVRESNMLVIEDIPEIVEKVLSILEDIDIKPLDLQFTVDLILGSMSTSSPAPSGTQDASAERKIRSDPVIKELSRLLTYDSFQRLDSTMISVQDNNRSTQMLGGKGMSFRLDLMPRYIREDKNESIRVELSLSKRQYKKDGSPITLTLINTTISVKNGERSVVGVSKLNGGDQALILILSGVVKK